MTRGKAASGLSPLVESDESDDGVCTGRGVSMAGALRAIERWARSLFRGHVWVTFV